MEAQLSYMWFGTVGSLNCLDFLWWRTWHQQPTIPEYSRYSQYICVFFFSSSSFGCFDKVLMSSVLSLAQPFIISVFVMLGFWLIIMTNPIVVMNLVEIQFCCRSKDKWRWVDSFCLSRWAWGTSNEIYSVHRDVVLVPWHSSPPETPPDIFLFCFSFKI